MKLKYTHHISIQYRIEDLNASARHLGCRLKIFPFFVGTI